MQEFNKFNSVLNQINALIKESKQDSNSCFTLSNELNLFNSFDLAQAQSWHFKRLSIAVKYIAYRANLLFKEPSELGLDVKSDNEQETTPRAQYDCLNSLDSDLKSSYDTFKGKFKPLVHDFIKALPCVKHYKESELNTVINAFDTHFDSLAGAPIPKRYYDLTHNNRKLLETLQDDFNLVYVNDRGVKDLAYWNGKTYSVGEYEIGKLIKKIQSIEPYTVDIKNDDGERKTKTIKQTFTNNAFFTWFEGTPLAIKDVNNSYYIPCMNGIIKLDPKDPLSAPKLLDFSPDIVTKYLFLANYRELDSFEPETIEKVERYLDTLSGKGTLKDNEYQEVKKRILEMSGTLLFKGQLFKSFFFLYGERDTGKSKYLNDVLFQLVDPDLVALTKINQCAQKFGADNIRGKVAIFSDETNFSNNYEIRETQQNTLKDLVSDTPSETEVKNGKNAKFTTDGKFFISSNRFIQLDDQATRQKMCFVLFPQKMNKVNHDVFLDMTNQDIKDYFFYLCLKNLQQVLDNGLHAKEGYFTKSDFLNSYQQGQEFEDCEFYADFRSWETKSKIGDNLPFNKGLIFDDKNSDLYSFTYYVQSFKEYIKANAKEGVRPKLPLDREIKHIFMMYFDLQTLQSNFRYKNKGKNYKTNSYFIPKSYQGKAIKSPSDLNDIIENQRLAIANTNNLIREHTDDQAKIILEQNLDSGI